MLNAMKINAIGSAVKAASADWRIMAEKRRRRLAVCAGVKKTEMQKT